MGLSRNVAVRGAIDLAALLDKLQRAGLQSTIVMVDSQLVAPGPPPARWRDLRLKTPAGTVALKLDGASVAVTVFGNADAQLTLAQETIAKLLAE